MSDSRSISINDFAVRKSRQLAAKIFLSGFIVTLLFGILVGSFHHYNSVNNILSVAEKSLAQPIALGGEYIPLRITSGLIATKDFSDVWITNPDGDILFHNQAKNTLEPKAGSSPKIPDTKLVWSDYLPHLILHKDIQFNNERIGAVTVSHKIPLLSIFWFATGLIAVFSVLAAYFLFSARQMAFSVARPLANFSSFLKENIGSKTLKAEKNEWRFSEIVFLNKILVEHLNRAKQSELATRKALANAQVARIADQVRHDVKASLFIAESLVKTESLQDSKSKSLLNSVFERITNTVNDIPKIGSFTEAEIDGFSSENNSLEIDDKPRSCHLVSLLRQIISEAKYSNITKDSKVSFELNFDQNFFNTFIEVEAERFKRTLINIYNNAIQAISQNNGTITTSFSVEDGVIDISISDDGCGIDQDILSKLGRRGATYNKPNGSGLGLASSIENMKRWSGSLDINSELGVGTIVTLSLPESEENHLYPSQITIPSECDVIIVDDDPSVHELWRHRFSEIQATGKKPDLIHVDSVERAEEALEDIGNQDCIVFMDNDLRNASVKGFDLVKRLGFADKAILVTSNGTSSALYEMCSEIDLPIVPKVIQRDIPLVIA